MDGAGRPGRRPADRVGRRRRLPAPRRQAPAQGRLLGVSLAASIGNRDVAGGVMRAVEGRPLEERELVRRARRGDERAFEELVRMHQETAFRVAYLIAGSEAEDAGQEGVLTARGALRRFGADA